GSQRHRQHGEPTNAAPARERVRDFDRRNEPTMRPALRAANASEETEMATETTLAVGAASMVDGETPEILAARDRGQNQINIGGNTVTQATEHLPEQQRLLVRWLHTHARNNRWGW